MKLQTEDGVIEGHDSCSAYLQKTLEDLLLHPANLDPAAQEALLDHVEEVFTKRDNDKLTAPVTREEVWESVLTSNANSAPGTDGITSLVYREHFDILGDALTDVVKEIHDGKAPTQSQGTSMMIFTTKPKKQNCIKASSKRRISLLNCDFKTITGIELNRYKHLLTHTLSANQMAAGDNRRISHAITLARDAIFTAGKSKEGCGLADLDYEAAFDFLSLEWVRLVMKKKGVTEKALDRFTNLYKGGTTIPVVNNMLGNKIQNNGMSLRQGDRPS